MSQPDRDKWNARWAETTPRFTPHPLLDALLALAPSPDGEILELAAGPSGTALALAARGRAVTAVDVSNVALAQLAGEAARRGLGDRVRVLPADLDAWSPPAGAYALVYAIHFWDPRTFAAAAAAVAPGGVLAWETFTLDERRYRPSCSAAFCLAPGAPASLLPAGFTVVDERDLDDGAHATRRLVARRAATP